jgi:hypothetical protein
MKFRAEFAAAAGPLAMADGKRETFDAWGACSRFSH